MGHPRILTLIACRLVAAVLLVVLPIGVGPVRMVLVLVVLAVSVLLVIRSQYGHDGADQLSLLCFVAFAIAESTGQLVPVLWFIAGQSALAYLTAGVAKLASPVWRSGRALPEILRTEAYGNTAAYVLVKDKAALAALGTRSVIVFECLFPLALLGNPVVTATLIVSGVLFHAMNVAVMRLHTFFWSFIATYPAVVYCAAHSPFGGWLT
jgi:hypothetical protein